jgi:S1-C subfamily serine protease
MKGQVVGMNALGYQNMGFAVSSNSLSRIVDSLITKGFFVHPWLGISGGAITPDMAQSVGLPRNYSGVVVGSVQSGSPANKSGLQGVSRNAFSGAQNIGDIITGIDGHPVRSMDDLINYIDSHNVGDSVVLTLNRHGDILNLSVNLQGRPPLLPQAQTQSTSSGEGH